MSERLTAGHLARQQFKNEADFPLTVTGKVQKFKIRQIAMREVTLDKDAHDFKFVDDTDENKSR